MLLCTVVVVCDRTSPSVTLVIILLLGAGSHSKAFLTSAHGVGHGYDTRVRLNLPQGCSVTCCFHHGNYWTRRGTIGAPWLQSYKSPLAYRGSLIAIMKLSFGAAIATMVSLNILLNFDWAKPQFVPPAHPMSQISPTTVFNRCAEVWHKRRKPMSQT